MSRHETSFPAPPLVVGVAVGTDTAIVIDVLDVEEVDTLEDDESKDDFADEVEEDMVVVEVVTLDEVDDACDVAEVDETGNVIEEAAAGALQSLGTSSFATRRNFLLMAMVCESCA